MTTARRIGTGSAGHRPSGAHHMVGPWTVRSSGRGASGLWPRAPGRSRCAPFPRVGERVARAPTPTYLDDRSPVRGEAPDKRHARGNTSSPGRVVCGGSNPVARCSPPRTGLGSAGEGLEAVHVNARSGVAWDPRTRAWTRGRVVGRVSTKRTTCSSDERGTGLLVFRGRPARLRRRSEPFVFWAPRIRGRWAGGAMSASAQRACRPGRASMGAGMGPHPHGGGVLGGPPVVGPLAQPLCGPGGVKARIGVDDDALG